MSLFGFLVVIGRELLPFLKEALLEGQTFRVWLRSNWLTLAFLLCALAQTLMVAHLSDLIHAQMRHSTNLRAQLNAVIDPGSELIVRYEQLREKNQVLREENQLLAQGVDDSEEVIERYLTWMERCGMNVRTGQCPSQRPARPPTRPPEHPQQTPTTTDDPEKRVGFLRRLRQLLGGDKEE